MSKHIGSCHCGAVKYELDAEITSANECNCSHCSRKGFLLTFVEPTQFKLLSGEEALSEYRFNKKAIQHLFCKHCGVESFARGRRPVDGKEVIAVNVRCLEDFDRSKLSVRQIDGKSF